MVLGFRGFPLLQGLGFVGSRRGCCIRYQKDLVQLLSHGIVKTCLSRDRSDFGVIFPLFYRLC